MGQGLIQSAVGGVNTSGLEKDLEKMNDKWNSLKDKVRLKSVRIWSSGAKFIHLFFFLAERKRP